MSKNILTEHLELIIKGAPFFPAIHEEFEGQKRLISSTVIVTTKDKRKHQILLAREYDASDTKDRYLEFEKEARKIIIKHS